MTANLYFGPYSNTPHPSVPQNPALSGLAVTVAQRKTLLNYTLTLSNAGDMVVADYIRVYVRWYAHADIVANADARAFATIYGTAPVVQWQGQLILPLASTAWSASGQCTIPVATQNTLLVVATLICTASNQGVTLAAITQDQCAAVNMCP